MIILLLKGKEGTVYNKEGTVYNKEGTVYNKEGTVYNKVIYEDNIVLLYLSESVMEH